MRKGWLPTVILGALAACLAGGMASGDGSTAKAAPPAAGSTVKGIVTFQGTVPKPTHIDMSADPKCAQIHPSGATTEDIMADNNGGLQNVVVYVSAGLGDRKFD